MANGEPMDFCAEASERSAQVIQIDSSKHVTAVAVCAVVCGLCLMGTCWSLYQMHWTEVHHHDDAMDLQDEYQKVRNHVIELEARTKVLTDEVEKSHERR